MLAVAAIPILGVGAGNSPTATVPFVGCESYGQTQKLPAPKGQAELVPITPKDAEALAWYASADGIGVLGPRGWACEGYSGSSGFGIFLAPRESDLRNRIQKNFEGPAIEIYHITSEASGTYGVARLEARVFPACRAAARKFWEGLDLPFPRGPYPRDSLTYRSKTVVEYRTPSGAEGLGTDDSWFTRNGAPVSGVVVLLTHGPNVIGFGPDAIILYARLPAGLAALTPVIVRDVEREAVAPRK